MWLPEFLNKYINNRYGSKRALLNNIKYSFYGMLGFYSDYSIDSVPFKPQRYVFVCAGNICRSPIAEATAKAEGANAISFGLDTRGGDGPDPRALAYARKNGLSVDEHITTTAEHYKPMPGDLVVAMEPKHLQMYQEQGFKEPIVLLGTTTGRKKYFIADPYNTNPTFFDDCEGVVVKYTKKLISYGS